MIKRKSITRTIVTIICVSILLVGSIAKVVSMKKLSEKKTDELKEQCLEVLRDKGNSPVVSEEVRTQIEETLTGFTGGFVENNGQKNNAIHYYTESSQMAIGFGTSELRFSMALSTPEYQTLNDPLGTKLIEDEVNYTTINLEFLGSSNVVPVAKEPTGVYSHSFIGSDQSKWSSNNQFYSRVVYPNLYDKIDLVYELKNGQLKYEFFVYPGGDITDIMLHWTGPVVLELVDHGIKVKTQQNDNNIDSTPENVFVDTSPIIYQSITRDTPIEGTFNLLNSTTYGFEVPTYDPTKLLIIDPLILTYSTYISGSDFDVGYGITVDSSGNIYVAGYTRSTDFPTVNAYNATGDGSTSTGDVFVCKLNATGNELLYSTYISGSDFDVGYGITVDSSGNVYVAGYTKSTDFPTVNAYNTTGDGSTSYWDVFVCKLNATGNELLYSTYISGSNNDLSNGIAVDSNGNAFVTGWTYSTDFPTVNAYNTTGDGSTGSEDAFVCKLNATGNELLYSTYISGSGNDSGWGITVDSSGNAYVTGVTDSTDFPTVNAYNDTGDGSTSTRDVFVCKLNATGNELLYSTYISGSDQDYGYGIVVDNSGNVYITGYTLSTDFPTVNAYNDTGDGSTSTGDGFVCKLTYIPPSAPSAPRSLSATPGDNFITLSWTAPSDDGDSPVTNYHVYRGTTTGDYSYLGNTTSTNFNDTTVINGTTYFYVVTAINAAGESAYSNEVSVTPLSQEPTSETTTPKSNVGDLLVLLIVLGFFSALVSTLFFFTRKRKKKK